MGLPTLPIQRLLDTCEIAVEVEEEVAHLLRAAHIRSAAPVVEIGKLQAVESNTSV